MVMKMNEKSNPRSRNWAMILYPDDDKHVFLLSYFPNYYRCTWILHDKDVYTEKSKSVLSGEHKAGELKKAHYHFVIQFDNPRYLSGVKEMLSQFTGENFHVEPVSSLAGYLLYFTHEDLKSVYEGKTIYPKDEIKGSTSLISEREEMRIDSLEALQILLNMILLNHWSFSDTMEFLCSNPKSSLWSAMKSYQHIITRVCHEQYYSAIIDNKQSKVKGVSENDCCRL